MKEATDRHFRCHSTPNGAIEHLEEKARELAKQQEKRAKQLGVVAERNLYLAQIQLARRLRSSGETSRVYELLDGQFPEVASPDYRGWEWYCLLSQCQTAAECRHLKAQIESSHVLAWFSDSRRLATPSEDGTVTIWEAVTGRVVSKLSCDGAQVLSVAWSPSKQLLAAGTNNGRVKIWDTATLQERVTLRTTRIFRVVALAFDPTGQRLASATEDSSLVSIWDTKSGTELCRLPGFYSGGRTLSWSPNGAQLAIACGRQPGRRVTIWDVATEQQVTRESHEYFRTGLALSWSPDGRLLASGGANQTLQVSNVATGDAISRFRAHSGAVRSTAWHPDASRLASAGDGRYVRIWDTSTWQEAFQLDLCAGTRLKEELLGLDLPAKIATQVAWSPDGRRLAVATSMWLASVFGGLADVWALDPNLVRLVALFLGIATGGLPLLVTYIVAWVVVPLSQGP